MPKMPRMTHSDRFAQSAVEPRFLVSVFLCLLAVITRKHTTLWHSAWVSVSWEGKCVAEAAEESCFGGGGESGKVYEEKKGGVSQAKLKRNSRS